MVYKVEGATPYWANFLGGVSAQQTYNPLLCVRARVWRPDGLGCVAGTLCVGGPVPTLLELG